MRSALALLVLGAVAVSPGAAQGFLDVAAATGVDYQHQVGRLCEPPPIGVGSAWADVDNDGDVDLFVTNQNGPNRLFRNQGSVDGGLPSFSEIAASLGVDQPLEGGLGTVFVDYDNDGDQDLFVGNWNGNTLFKNLLVETGSLEFADVTDAAGLADDGRVITAAWGDFDEDGFLDVYLAKHADCLDSPNSQDALYRANGDGTFMEVTGQLCDGPFPCDQILGLGFTAAWVDYDNDGDSDLYLVNDNIDGVYYHNVLWRNDGPNDADGWIFTDVSAESGTDISLNGMGLAVGDVDNDGDFDLAFSNIGPNKLLANDGDGTFTDVSAGAGIERSELPDGGTSITWGSVFFDADNDQLLDLFIAAGYISVAPFQHPNAFFGNLGNGTFADLSEQSGLDDGARGRAVSIADFDEDGWVDLYVGNYGQMPRLYRNQGADLGLDSGWLTVEVEGTVSNRDAIGAVVEVTTDDGVVQKRLISSGATHGGGDQRRAFFGLGDEPDAEVSVRWPSGIYKEFGTFDANQHLSFSEPEIRLVLARPVPGEAGKTNRFDLSGGVGTGEQVVLYGSLSDAGSELPNCLGVEGELADQKELVVGALDGSGEEVFEFFVPESGVGRTVFFQAVQTNNCAISNVIEVTFDE